jgi:flagellar hook-associated protein 3 FlgL
MSFVSIGDLSSSIRLRFLNADIKSRVGQLGSELASGRVTDLSKHLGGNLDRLGAVNRSLRMVETYRITHSELVYRGVGLQASLEKVQTSIESAGAKTISAANTATDASLNAAANAALENLQSAIGALNNQSGGRSLFSGQAFK